MERMSTDLVCTAEVHIKQLRRYYGIARAEVLVTFRDAEKQKVAEGEIHYNLYDQPGASISGWEKTPFAPALEQVVNAYVRAHHPEVFDKESAGLTRRTPTDATI